MARKTPDPEMLAAAADARAEALANGDTAKVVAMDRILDRRRASRPRECAWIEVWGIRNDGGSELLGRVGQWGRVDFFRPTPAGDPDPGRRLAGMRVHCGRGGEPA